MVRIAVCDDNEQDLTTLCAMLEESRGKQAWSVRAFESPAHMLCALEAGATFDICLLDILMPEINGIDLARSLILRMSKPPVIIFLTSSPEFALGAYQVGAVHYLLKPVQQEELVQALNRAMEKLTPVPVRRQVLQVPTAGGVVAFAAEELLWAEAVGHTVHYHLQDGSIVVTRSLRSSFSASVEELLRQPVFLRCHQSFVINLAQVAKANTSGFLMKNNAIIPIARSRQKEAVRRWLDFLEQNRW